MNYIGHMHNAAMHTPSLLPVDAAAGVDAARCPLCQQPNACAAVASGGAATDCWCMHVPFSAELLARVPAAAKGLACICPACVQAQAQDRAC
jgi:hypothetical protein